MASSLLRASPFALLSRLKPPRPSALHLRGLLSLSTSASAPAAQLRTLASAAAATDAAATPPEEAAAAGAKVERLQPLQWPARDALCGELGAGDAGRRVRLCGWVALRRAHAGLTFLTLRDRSGMVQATTLPEHPEVYNIVNKLRVESVVAVEGVIRPRPVDAINADM